LPIKDSLLIGLNAGGRVGHDRVYLRDAVPGERELGIADSKRLSETEGPRNSEASRWRGNRSPS
jgi:hypothetical protein